MWLFSLMDNNKSLGSGLLLQRAAPIIFFPSFLLHLSTRWTRVSLHRRFPWQRSAGARAASPPDAVHVHGVSIRQPTDTSPGGGDQNPSFTICQPRRVRESLWSGKSVRWPRLYHMLCPYPLGWLEQHVVQVHARQLFYRVSLEP